MGHLAGYVVEVKSEGDMPAWLAGTVLVQSLATMSDTEFMLDLALRHDFILGVVGWMSRRRQAERTRGACVA